MSSLPAVVVAAGRVVAGDVLRELDASGVHVLAVTHDRDAVVPLLEKHRPQVLLLDAQLRDASEVARAVMTRCPVPIIALVPTADTGTAGRDLTANGVVDVIPFPVQATTAELGRRIKVVSGVTVVRRPPARSVMQVRSSELRLIAVGASTGGPAALATLLQGLSGLDVPVVVVQHIHADFVEGLVRWLETTSSVEVRVARDGELLLPGRVYVAPPSRHLRVRADLTCQLVDGDGGLHCPSVDELFTSVAASIGAGAVGVLLTGMGRDGATGLRAMVDAGAVTIVQDEQSSAVYGMPRAAVGLGAAQRVLALPDIAPAVRTAAARTR